MRLGAGMALGVALAKAKELQEPDLSQFVLPFVRELKSVLALNCVTNF